MKGRVARIPQLRKPMLARVACSENRSRKYSYTGRRGQCPRVYYRCLRSVRQGFRILVLSLIYVGCGREFNCMHLLAILCCVSIATLDCIHLSQLDSLLCSIMMLKLHAPATHRFILLLAILCAPVTDIFICSDRFIVW